MKKIQFIYWYKRVPMMYKIGIYITFTLIVLLVHGLAYSETLKGKINLYNNIRRTVQVDVEIVDTFEKRQKGLMFRKELGKNEGMFFVFRNEAVRSFWMWNTFISLDIIFISKDLQVVSLIKATKPCKTPPCKIYSSKYPAMYTLEVNAGFIDQYGINNETRIEILPWKMAWGCVWKIVSSWINGQYFSIFVHSTIPTFSMQRQNKNVTHKIRQIV